ncbi:MAG: class I SAM-dependent methyltransferase [Nitrospira sp.]
MSEHPHPFSNPQSVGRYAEGPPRIVPGYNAMQCMTGILIAERVPENARVRVLGAGGGLELKVFSDAHPGWTFDGVDPAAEMLKLAERTLGPLASRAHLHQGYIDDAPEGPFDAATCLLTLHYLSPEERRRTASEIRRRLKPHAPFVIAHFSISQGEGDRATWLARYAAFAIASGLDPDHVQNAHAAIDTKLTVLTPEQDEAILHEAGFSNISLFYAGFTFRGWVAYA